ncbi:MAG: adenylate/guanylate cyclase domain-containing protein [Bacteroidales bacterium]
MGNKKTRRLAAIMFTDIVGYTALMQKDEKAGAEARAQHRQKFQQYHKIYNGDILQYFGDGTLSVFKSGVEAVECAVAIQKALKKDEPVPLRIGLHMGDIVFDGTDIYGDGVNLASRIESMCVSGGILLSAKLNDELKNHKKISTRSLGRFELKNIIKPVEIYTITNKGITAPQFLKGIQLVSSKTIAVLPFANMSTSEENEYFSDGITEEIINALSKVKSLKVTSRTSSFFFKNKNIPIKQIGKELNVSTILEGSVRLSGNTIRITAQLIQAEEDFHFWSETWDRKLENIFEIQDEISLIIADKLREQFGHFEIQDHLVEKQTDNINAYEYSLKAQYYKNKWNPDDVKTAISLYNKALELDPKHTESVLGLADCYSFMATTGFMPAEEGWGKAAELTNQAQLLNDQLPGVHYLLSNIAFFISGNYKEAFKEMARAIEIKPNFVDAQQFMSFLYIISGEKKKAQHHLDIALSIDPLSQETLFFDAYFHYMVEDYSTSLEKLNSCLAQNPKNIPAHSVKCYCLLKLGRYDEVLNYFDKLPEDVVSPGDKLGLAGLAWAFKKDTKKTAEYLNLLIEQAQTPDSFRANSYLFLIYAVSGDNDKAFEWIRIAIEDKISLMLFHFADPLVNPIKDDPRYAEYHKLIYQKDFVVRKSGKKKALLDNKTIDKYSERLINYLNDNKPYLDPDLSLRSLADQIDIHPNQLSWLLNESLGKNFNDFINHYRIETYKMLSKDPQNSNITIMGLAYESGFNSKTVFNTCFKKETGLTPKQFLNQ